MKIQNINDVESFFKIVDQCKGPVELVSPEGDRINLKSKLSSTFPWLPCSPTVSLRSLIS